MEKKDGNDVPRVSSARDPVDWVRVECLDRAIKFLSSQDGQLLGSAVVNTAKEFEKYIKIPKEEE